jgi:hypothetical protein
MQGDVLPAADAHPELQAFQSIEPTHPLLVYSPAFSSQQHPDAQEAEARPGVRELANP